MGVIHDRAQADWMAILSTTPAVQAAAAACAAAGALRRAQPSGHGHIQWHAAAAAYQAAITAAAVAAGIPLGRQGSGGRACWICGTATVFHLVLPAALPLVDAPDCATQRIPCCRPCYERADPPAGAPILVRPFAPVPGTPVDLVQVAVTITRYALATRTWYLRAGGPGDLYVRELPHAPRTPPPMIQTRYGSWEPAHVWVRDGQPRQWAATHAGLEPDAWPVLACYTAERAAGRHYYRLVP